jgi:hypothetical protein
MNKHAPTYNRSVSVSIGTTILLLFALISIIGGCHCRPMRNPKVLPPPAVADNKKPETAIACGDWRQLLRD